jgi:hypothetical protein
MHAAFMMPSHAHVPVDQLGVSMHWIAFMMPSHAHVPVDQLGASMPRISTQLITLFTRINTLSLTIILISFSYVNRCRARLQSGEDCIVTHSEPLVCAVDAGPHMPWGLELAWFGER